MTAAPFLTWEFSLHKKKPTFFVPAHILLGFPSPISPPKSLKSYRSVGEIWCALLPTSLQKAVNKKKHTLRSRACVASQETMKGANTLRVGSLFWEEKKRVDFAHHKIGLKFE